MMAGRTERAIWDQCANGGTEIGSRPEGAGAYVLGYRGGASAFSASQACITRLEGPSFTPPRRISHDGKKSVNERVEWGQTPFLNRAGQKQRWRKGV